MHGARFSLFQWESSALSSACMRRNGLFLGIDAIMLTGSARACVVFTLCYRDTTTEGRLYRDTPAERSIQYRETTYRDASWYRYNPTALKWCGSMVESGVVLW